MVLPYLKLSFELCSYFCARTDNHSPTRHYPPGTTGCCTNLLLSRFPRELTVLPWRLQGVSQWFETQPQPNCLFESHSDPQVSSQHRALYKPFKIYRWITCGEKVNKYSKIHLFQYSFLVLLFFNWKRWLKKVLREWMFCFSMGSHKIVLDESILHHLGIKKLLLVKSSIESFLITAFLSHNNKCKSLIFKKKRSQNKCKFFYKVLAKNYGV